jgi:hypothetical protein
MVGRLKRGISLAVLVMAAACGGVESGPGGPTPVVATPAPQATPTAATARYRVSFDSTWRSETHPDDFPPDAHYSRLVGATHSDRVRFWAAGAPASAGIQAMAERGRTTPLDTEVQAAVAAGTARGLILGEALDRSPGVASAEFEIGRDHPLVTLVTMVAPSPDWFVGVAGLSLVENGDWVPERRVTLYPWDAGTDSGASYRSADQETQPRGTIQPLAGYPVVRDGQVAAFGAFSFRRVD